MDWKTWELCYPGYSDGEVDAMLGPVFGCATMSAGGRPGNFTMGPSDCDECESPNMQYNWVNYNYRCCPKCWNVIKKQLWRFLETKTKAIKCAQCLRKISGMDAGWRSMASFENKSPSCGHASFNPDHFHAQAVPQTVGNP